MFLRYFVTFQCTYCRRHLVCTQVGTWRSLSVDERIADMVPLAVVEGDLTCFQDIKKEAHFSPVEAQPLRGSLHQTAHHWHTGSSHPRAVEASSDRQRYASPVDCWKAMGS